MLKSFLYPVSSEKDLIREVKEEWEIFRDAANVERLSEMLRDTSVFD
jgi:hypothetical protein